MQPSVRRATAFAVVGSFSLLAPLAGPLTAVPFALIAVAGRLVSGGRIFELFARPPDRIDGQLRGLVGFALAATALALLTSLAELPPAGFVATVFLVGYGNLTERVVCERTDTPLRRALGFTAGGTVAAVGGQVAVATLDGTVVDPSIAAFLALSGALVAGLLRTVLTERDDPLVMVSVAVLLWAFVGLGVTVGAVELGIAIGIAGTFGYVSWLTGTASVSGMLAGVVSGLLTIVLGGLGWFVVLIAFFGLGGLASKYRYQTKRSYGVAESDKGARGSANVLGNAAVALLAVIGFAAADKFEVAPILFVFAFAGSLAAAMSDTISSEVGVLYGRPRLITNFDPVARGTDGGVTVRGSLVGAVGAAVVAVLALWLLEVGPVGVVVLVVAGTVGMIVDSLLGATVEGGLVGNHGVNFLATLSGALVGAGGAVVIGVAPL